MSWQENVKAIAPTLGGLLATFGGPAGVLAGAGLTAVAKALGVPDDPNSVEAAVQAGITPEQRASLVAADLEYKKAMIEAGIRTKELDIQESKNILLDVQDARSHNAGTVGILHLGYMINAFSYLCVIMTLVGCYFVLSGARLAGVDPSALVAVGGIVGAALQWVYSNSTQANAFFFGSSPSSRQSSAALAESVSAAAKTSQK